MLCFDYSIQQLKTTLLDICQWHAICFSLQVSLWVMLKQLWLSLRALEWLNWLLQSQYQIHQGLLTAMFPFTCLWTRSITVHCVQYGLFHWPYATLPQSVLCRLPLTLCSTALTLTAVSSTDPMPFGCNHFTINHFQVIRWDKEAGCEDTQASHLIWMI